MSEKISVQKLIDLESKFSFQEAIIEELRQTVHEQYLAIQKLEKKVKLITEHLDATQNLDTSHKNHRIIEVLIERRKTLHRLGFLSRQRLLLRKGAQSPFCHR
jgi:uncharacterized coiled-coil protein SlyX